MTLGEKIRELRIANGLTQEELAAKLKTTKQAIWKYENDVVTNLPLNRIEGLAAALNARPAYLMGWEESLPEEDETVQIHFIGDVAAGYNHLAVDEYETMEVPKAWLRGRPISNFFAMRVSGNSMYPEFKNGDEVLCIVTNEMGGSGKIGVIIYNGEEATLKRLVYKQGEDWLDLVPINPEYMTKRIEGYELEQCRVIGKPLRLIRNVEEG